MVAVRLAQMKDTDFRRRHYEILRELQQAGLLGAMSMVGSRVWGGSAAGSTLGEWLRIGL
jgi:hypothetical protein